jgi:CRP-like cAMP-binding protein
MGEDVDGTPSFAERLPPASRARFERMGRGRDLRAGGVLVLEGDVASRAFLVLDGLVKIESSHPDGRSPILALRGAGELIGELGALDGGGRSATVTAVVATRVREFSSQELHDAVRDDPDTSFALLAHLTARLREADRFRVSYMGDDVPRRLGRSLLELAEAHGHPTEDGRGVVVDVPLSQEDLASLVAASRDSVAKVLHTWRNRGLVSTARRSIVIVDLTRFGAAYA